MRRAGPLPLLVTTVATLLGACRSPEPARPASTGLPEIAGIEAAQRDTVLGPPLPRSLVEAEDLPAPAFALPALLGDTLRLADLRGRVVLVNFWATWCAPCVAEIPDLNALHEELGPRGLAVIGLSLDEEGFAVVRPFTDRVEIRYPIAVDDGRVADAFGGVLGLPTTFVVTREGRVTRRILGTLPVDVIRPELEALLGAR